MSSYRCQHQLDPLPKRVAYRSLRHYTTLKIPLHSVHTYEIGYVDMLAVGGSIYEVTRTVEWSEAIEGTLEQ